MALALISTASQIGLYATVLMADQDDELVSVTAVAESFAVSQNHVAKVLQRLVRGGILRSVRGAHGGYALEIEADKLTMAQVVEAIDGPFSTPCFGCEGRLGGACGHFASCVVRDVLTAIGSKFIKEMRTTTIATLARRGRQRKNPDVDVSCLRRGG